MTTVTIVSPRQLQELQNQLRQKNGDLERQFRQSVRDAAGPVVNAVQTRVRSLRITGEGAAKVGHELGRGALRKARPRKGRSVGVPLREAVAQVVKIRTDPRGVIIEVDAYALPATLRNMPLHLESRKGWRAPTFGRKAKSQDWHHEQAGPWFYTTCRNNRNTFQEALRAQMGVAAQTLAEKVRSV